MIGAARLVQEIFSPQNNKVVVIDAGPKYYIGYYRSAHDPLKFIFHADARKPIESKLSLFSNDC